MRVLRSGVGALLGLWLAGAGLGCNGDDGMADGVDEGERTQICIRYCTRVSECTGIVEEGCQNGCFMGDDAEFDDCANEQEILMARSACNELTECPDWEACEGALPLCME